MPKPSTEYDEIGNKIDNSVSEYSEIGILDAVASRVEYSNIT